jgi:hypothetical protein
MAVMGASWSLFWCFWWKAAEKIQAKDPHEIQDLNLDTVPSVLASHQYL